MNQALFQRPFDGTIKETTLFLLKPHGPQQILKNELFSKIKLVRKIIPPSPLRKHPTNIGSMDCDNPKVYLHLRWSCSYLARVKPN